MPTSRMLSDPTERGLSTIQLLTFLRTNREGKKKGVYARVVPRDGLKKLNVTNKKKVAIIANTHRSTQPGEHWVAFYCARNNKNIDFFCSYGTDISEYPRDIRDFGNALCRAFNIVRIVSNRQ